MNCTLYPHIFYRANHHLSIIQQNQVQPHLSKLQIIHPQDPKNLFYSTLTQKLFPEITLLKEMLWICQLPSTSVVRVYFSEPTHYPISSCCQQCIFIEFEPELNGSFNCLKCLKQIYQFVYLGENQSQQNDGNLFLNKIKQIKCKKEILKEMFISHKFRSKNLKNNFFKQDKMSPKGGFIFEITGERLRNSVETKQLEQKEKKDETKDQKLSELKEIMLDIFS